MSASANILAPLHVFRFRVDFYGSEEGSDNRGSKVPLCSGRFSQCSGLEANMEPKTIKSGGRNRGAAQRMGRVSFATVVLKRGVTASSDLWRWFDLVAGGAYAFRLDAEVVLLGPGDDPDGQGALRWKLERALPTKFKTADMDATRGTEVGIEELHFVHEGLSLDQRGRS